MGPLRKIIEYTSSVENEFRNGKASKQAYLFLLLVWSQSSHPPCATTSSKYVYENTTLENCPMARPTYRGPLPVTLQPTNANPVFSSAEFLSCAAIDPNLVAIECNSQSYPTITSLFKT